MRSLADGGGEHWATIASLIETCKPNGVDPYAYLADVIEGIVAGHPQSQLDDLLPWALFGGGFGVTYRSHPENSKAKS